MADSAPPTTTSEPLVALRRRRQEVIDHLTDTFARDLIDVDQFEERVNQAHRATSLAGLDKVVADLAPMDREALVRSGTPEVAIEPAVPTAGRRKRRWMVAVMSGVRRTGSWRPSSRMKLVCLMGGAEIDFREVSLPAGEIELSVTCVMGGAEIIVPPGLQVECEGIGIMGGFDHVNRAPQTPDPGAPLLRIKGLALMGGIAVSTRLPGESERDARRRLRDNRRALRDRRRRQLAGGGD